MEGVETVGKDVIDDLHLINLVRPNEVLYKKMPQNFKIAERKELVWRGIALQLGVSVERCRRRWIVLRDRYSNEWRRLERGLTKEIWPLLEDLSFLKGHIKPRNRDGSYKIGKIYAPELICSETSASPSSDLFFKSEEYMEETATSTAAWSQKLQTDEANAVDKDTKPHKFSNSFVNKHNIEVFETVKKVVIDDLHLINLVRPNEVLYKKMPQNFKMAERKELVWRGIALQLGVSVERCRRRWIVLRDRYSNECRRMERGLAKEIWPFLEVLSFLKSHIKPRNRDGSYKIGKIYAPELIFPKISASPSSDPFFSSEEYMAETDTSTTVWPQNLQTVEANTVDTDTEPQKFSNSFANECKFPLDNSSKGQVSHGGNTAIQAFGEMIVATICEMSPRMQAKVMKQVTDLVMTGKLQDVDDSNTGVSSNLSSESNTFH